MAEKGIKGEEIEVKRKKKVTSLLRPSCLKVSSAEESPAIDGGPAGEAEVRRNPTHLVVTVNGIIGSADDWRFGAKQFMKKYPEDIIILRSSCNGATRTFHGIDVMGKRLADEVASFVESKPGLQKISFVAHSLGGLIARYAIALLYNNNNNNNNNNNKIAGLEPINFITFATPHLGCISHKQIPILRGVRMLEKFAYNISFIAGKTGKHLFLKDRENGKPPLLLQLAHDTGDLQFLSALKSFKRHVAYSNYCFDFIVGRKTSSICRQTELPKSKDFMKNNKYPHIVYEEKPNNITEEDKFSDHLIYQAKTIEEMEEVMIRGLNKIAWERIHVSFRKSKQKIFAHSTIQVKTYFLNSDGADVIFHMLDHFVL